jgi:hypothetical protein
MIAYSRIIRLIMKKIILIIIFILTTLMILPTIVLAESPQSFNLTPQKTLPGSFLYPLKRLNEKIKMKLTFSEKEKERYGITLLEKRLSELASLVDRKDATYLEGSAQRFAAQAGFLANLASHGDKEMKNSVLSYFAGYKPILEKLRDAYPANYAYWLSIQQDIDTLNILSGQLK